MFSFLRVSVARQFMLVSFLILLTGMLVIGLWLGQQIRRGVIHRTAAVTALYMDSLLAHHLTSLTEDRSLDADTSAELEELLTETLFGQEIVSFKLWSPDEQVLYSPDPDLVSARYENAGVRLALQGEVISEISRLDEPEHAYEARSWRRLIETYTPIRANGSGEIIAVAEFYQLPGALDAEIRSAQIRSWLVVGTATLAMYLLLNGLVAQASHTIRRQQADLEEKIAQLQELLAQNEVLNRRVRRAAARTTALNEQFLRRISSDLHDGPAQDLALALLRMETIGGAYAERQHHEDGDQGVARDLATVKNALEAALREIRNISAGLRLPELAPLTIRETIQRAIRDYERKSRRIVEQQLDSLEESAPLPVRIALYRIIQEALGNGYRHAGGVDQVVKAEKLSDTVKVLIANRGTFDLNTVPSQGHLGLATMRERAEALGGSFAIQSDAAGTLVESQLPLHIHLDDDW